MLAPDTVMAGKYVIVQPLESGGMGDVYEAFQRDLGRSVAVKVLRRELAGDPAMFQRLRREAEAAASLGHPNIVQVLEFQADPDEPMLVMEKLEGRSLRELLEKSGPLAPPRATFIALQILSALAAAHAANIVHRDIKPANVFLLKTLAVPDFVKVLDFGIAKLLDPAAGAPALTNLGDVLGTASYMAPEQAQGQAVDGRADLFAVGSVLFEALSGKKPRTFGAAALIEAGSKPCMLLRDAAPSIDPKLAAVVDRALALDRHARFANAEEMAKALAPFAPAWSLRVDAPPTADAGAGLGDIAATDRKALAETAPPTTAPIEKPIAPTLDPTIRSASAPPAPAPRTSYQPPLVLASQPVPIAMSTPRGIPPRASRPSKGSSAWKLVLVIPMLAILTGIGVIVLVFYLVGERQEADLELVGNATPARCPAPSSCTGRTKTHNRTFSTCSPSSTRSLRRGDVVFVGSSTIRPARYLGNGPHGTLKVVNASGTESDVEPGSVRGPYCER